MRDVLERVQSQRQASARPDQRRARSVQDRGRPVDAVAVRLFDQGSGAGRLRAVEPLASQKNLALDDWRSRRSLPAGHGDERRLSQVLLNLVGNAIKFTDKGEVAIDASRSNGSFRVAVRDSGPGIAAADQAKIFEEFQQADNTSTRQEGRHRLGPRHLQAHRRDAWRPYFGRVRARQRFDVSRSRFRSTSSGRGKRA